MNMMKPTTLNPLPAHLIKSFGEVAHAHAKACKKPLDECKVCKLNMQAFSLIPAPALAKLLQDRQASSASFTLADSVVYNTIERAFTSKKPLNKRAKADLKAAAAIYRNYEKMGGRL